MSRDVELNKIGTQSRSDWSLSGLLIQFVLFCFFLFFFGVLLSSTNA